MFVGLLQKYPCFFFKCHLLCFTKFKRNLVKGGNFKNQVFLEHPNKRFGPSCFVRALALVHLIPSWLIWSEIQYTLNVVLHCNPVQGQYRARTGFSLCSKISQGKTCFHYRESLISLQGIPCDNYYLTGHALGIWICGCSLYYKREHWASKSAGAHSTKSLKISGCKR